MSNASVVKRGIGDRALDEILTADALEFLAALHHQFEPTRLSLLEARRERREALRLGGTLGFLDETRHLRDESWQVAAPRVDYADRRVEITGPTDRKLVINALNSGARGFMADFEDASSPTWRNQVEGHVNLIDAANGSITYESGDGRSYVLADEVATLLVRPRGWHLTERNFSVANEPIAGSLFDFGLAIFHIGQLLLDRGSAPYFYLPKLEHYREARLWNEVFVFAEDSLGMPRESIRATVLVETLPAAFQMNEILWELRDHSYGLNAGRWDYMFSMIKCFRERRDFVLPDRNDVKMTAPFIRAYSKLLVQTCHRRGAFAMGGMAALIPSRTDADANQRAIDAVRMDKRREADAVFDGTWVAHPDVVLAAEAEFNAVLGTSPNQIHRQRDDVDVEPAQLLDVVSTPGAITEAGLRSNVSVSFQYISFWLTGRGAAAINNLMEDAATAEIARSQLWQWIRHGVQLDDGRTVTVELVREVLVQEMAMIAGRVGDDTWRQGRPTETRAVFERLVFTSEMPEFLTLEAYALLV
jgi:malate synthase